VQSTRRVGSDSESGHGISEPLAQPWRPSNGLQWPAMPIKHQDPCSGWSNPHNARYFANDEAWSRLRRTRNDSTSPGQHELLFSHLRGRDRKRGNCRRGKSCTGNAHHCCPGPGIHASSALMAAPQQGSLWQGAPPGFPGIPQAGCTRRAQCPGAPGAGWRMQGSQGFFLVRAGLSGARPRVCMRRSTRLVGNCTRPPVEVYTKYLVYRASPTGVSTRASGGKTPAGTPFQYPTGGVTTVGCHPGSPQAGYLRPGGSPRLKPCMQASFAGAITRPNACVRDLWRSLLDPPASLILST
jgi:hypothetical protein